MVSTGSTVRKNSCFVQSPVRSINAYAGRLIINRLNKFIAPARKNSFFHLIFSKLYFTFPFFSCIRVSLFSSQSIGFDPLKCFIRPTSIASVICFWTVYQLLNRQIRQNTWLILCQTLNYSAGWKSPIRTA